MVTEENNPFFGSLLDINGISNLIINWGVVISDNDGIARVYLPHSYSSNTYSAVAIHQGGSFATCVIYDSYKTLSLLPIRMIDYNGQTQGVKGASYISVGY